jgi:hypothetical protein
VLIAAIAAALTHDTTATTARTAPGTGTTLPVASTAAPSPSTSRTTLAPLPTTPAPNLSVTSTSVKPAVASPEAAANGLWAAYRAGNRDAAARFASPEVVKVLFEAPFSGEEGTFQGCSKVRTDTFDCRYDQPSAKYVMSAQPDTSGSFKVVMITISDTPTTTSSSSG